MYRLSTLLLAVSLASCSAGSRFVDDEREIELDTHKAGIVTYRELVESTWDSVETSLRRDALDYSEEREVALVGVDSHSGEELGEHRRAIVDALNDKMFRSRLFVVVNQNLVLHALSKIGSRDPKDLYIREYRQKFMSELEREGVTPGYLLFAELSSASTKGRDGWFTSGSKYRTYGLSLTLVDARSGHEVARERDVRTKEYLGD